MDFRGYKKVSDDGKTATLRHEKGHEIRIVKRALDKKLRRALDSIKIESDEPAEPQHLAEGGSVIEPLPQEEPVMSVMPEAAPAPAPAQAPVTINIQSGGQPQQPAAPAPEPMPNWQGIADPQAEALATVPKPAPGTPMLPPGPPVTDAALAGQEPTPEDRAAASARGTASPAAPSLTNYEPPPSALTPAAAPVSTEPDPMEAMQKKALNLGLQGISEQEKAESQLAQQRQQVLNQAVQQNIDLEYDTKQKLAENAREIDAVVQDINDRHINPNQYLENRSTGDKIRTAIGLILGGIAGGLTHQENPVLKMLNQQIERDLHAQQKNIDNRQSLLGALQKRDGDTRAAADMFRLIRANTIASQLDQAAAAAGTPAAKARAMQAKAQLMQQYAPLLMKSSLMSAVSKIAASGDPDAAGKMLPKLRMYAPDMAKDIESRYVPGVGVAKIPLDTKTRETLEARNTLQEQVHKLREFARQNEGTVLDRAKVQYGATLASTVQDAYRRANGQGVFKESESEFVKGIVAEDPTAFLNKLRVDPKLRALEDSNLAELNGLRRSVGLPLLKAAPTMIAKPANWK